MKTKRTLPLLFLLSLLDLSQTSPVTAAPYFTGEGAIAAARQMAPTGDPNNPFSYPFITTVAKAMIRNASSFPAGLLLGIDSRQGQGIDLRPMLLYELGILKSPVKLFASPKGQQKKTDEFPSLSITAIPDSPGEMPSAAPRLKPPSNLEGNDAASPDAVAADAITIKKSAPPRDEGSSLNVDLNKFSIDLSKDQLKNEVTSKLDSNLDVLAMGTPLPVVPNTVSAAHAFRFWTVPAAAARPPQPGLRTSDNYEGSFVMMSPDGLRAIEGRSFFLSRGRLLACSRAKQIDVDTAQAKIKIEPGATAFIEMLNPGLTRIRVIESSPSAPGVDVTMHLKGKSDQFKLSNGDDLIISEESLTDHDKGLQAKSGTASGGEHWNKTRFIIKELLANEQFFSTDQKNQNSEQRSALMALLKRVK